MAIVRMEPVAVRVRADWFDGTPREVTWGRMRLPVTRLTAVRRESAAYRAEIGPRTIFEVETVTEAAQRAVREYQAVVAHVLKAR